MLDQVSYDVQQRLSGLADQLAGRSSRGTASGSRSLPIRCSPEDVQALWDSRRAEVVDDAPARSVTLLRGPDQGEWGTTWTVELEVGAPLPGRATQLLAGAVVRRLKALAETGEIATTAHNPAYRGDAAHPETDDEGEAGS